MKYLFYLLSTLLLISCTQESRLEQALKRAGNNRNELEKVLAHFSQDSLKYQAACFLIENMPEKYAVVPDNPSDKYKQILPFLPQEDYISWIADNSIVWHILDSLSYKRRAKQP